MNNELLKQGLDKADKRVEKFSNKATKYLKGVAIAWAGTFAARGIKNIALAADSMERLEYRLIAIAGSSAKAQEAMGFLQQTAEKQSVSLLDLSDGYTRLSPAVKSGIISMDDMRRILTLANDNIKAFGLDSSEAKGLFLGLSQALGSGTVTMEDLRQVTDRLPGTLNAMAQATGMSVNEFKKFIATGEVTADMIKGSLITAFEDNAGAAEKMGSTLESATTRMENSLLNLSKAIGDAGLTDVFVGMANAVTEFADAMTESLQSIDKFTGLIGEMTAPVSTAGVALKAFANAFRLFNHEHERSFENLQKAAEEGLTIDSAVADPEKDLNSPTPEEKPEEQAAEAMRLEKEAEFVALQEAWERRAEFERQKLSEIKDITKNAQGELYKDYQVFFKGIERAQKVSGLAQTGALTNTFSNILSKAAKHNKALFEINKVAGIANAVVSTAQGAAEALKLPFPFNLVASATVAAAGYAKIQSIRSASYGGGSGASGGATASAPSISSDSSSSFSDSGNSRSTNVSISGISNDDLFSGAQLRELIAKLNEQAEDGVLIKGLSVS